MAASKGMESLLGLDGEWRVPASVNTQSCSQRTLREHKHALLSGHGLSATQLAVLREAKSSIMNSSTSSHTSRTAPSDSDQKSNHTHELGDANDWLQESLDRADYGYDHGYY